MFKKAYIITFDIGGALDTFDYKKFHDSLITANGVLDWWHHLGGTYIIIVETTTTAASISNFVMQIAPNKKFFVSHLDLKDYNGWLAKEAWDWINKYFGKLI